MRPLPVLLALAACTGGADPDDTSVPVTGVDCPDGSADGDPLAPELCDGIDNDCDGLIDDADDFWSGSSGVVVYTDADGDGYGDASTGAPACEAGEGESLVAGDCNDADAAISPDAVELCDADDVDEDCDGAADDADADGAEGAADFWADADNDGYGNPDVGVTACDAPVGFADVDTDCNDVDATLSPDTVWYADADGDGFGDAAATATGCEAPAGHVADDADCDDAVGTGAAVNPTAAEICDTLDNDCDGAIDDADGDVDPGSYLFFEDGDGDGFGGDSVGACTAAALTNGVDNTDDCDDANAGVYPGAAELCDGVASDCLNTAWTPFDEPDFTHTPPGGSPVNGLLVIPAEAGRFDVCQDVTLEGTSLSGSVPTPGSGRYEIVGHRSPTVTGGTESVDIPYFEAVSIEGVTLVHQPDASSQQISVLVEDEFTLVDSTVVGWLRPTAVSQSAVSQVTVEDVSFLERGLNVGAFAGSAAELTARRVHVPDPGLYAALDLRDVDAVIEDSVFEGRMLIVDGSIDLVLTELVAPTQAGTASSSLRDEADVRCLGCSFVGVSAADPVVSVSDDASLTFAPHEGTPARFDTSPGNLLSETSGAVTALSGEVEGTCDADGCTLTP